MKLDNFIKEIKDIFIALFQGYENMKHQIVHLQSCNEILQLQIQLLQNEQNEKKKLRTVAEILTPAVKETRCSMINKQIPDSYYSKSMIRACLLRGGKSNNILGSFVLQS